MANSILGAKDHRLTYEQGMNICRQLFSICDRKAELFDNCRKEGFSAFVPRSEFDASYCCSPEDNKVHEKAAVELAKELISKEATNLPALPGQIKRGYTSPYIEELKQQRDAVNGCGESEIGKHFPREEQWLRMQYDPCLRSQAIARLNNLWAYEKAWQAAIDRQWEYFQVELKAHTLQLGKGWEISREDRCKFIISAARKYGEELGFTFEKSKSSKWKPAVWKPMSEDWGLRWIISDTATFAFSPLIRKNERSEQPVLDSQLVLCANYLKGDIEKDGKPGEVLSLNYKLAVPTFIVAYRKFYDYEELELIVKANFTLLSFVLEEIEAAVLSAI